MAAERAAVALSTMKVEGMGASCAPLAAMASLGSTEELDESMGTFLPFAGAVTLLLDRLALGVGG